jgi:O-antigen/teichoic acid export membrane protein
MSTELAWLAWGATAVMVLFQGLTWLQMGLGEFVLASVLRGVFPAAAAALFGFLLLAGDSWSTPETAAGAFLISVAAVTIGVAVALVRGAPRPVLDRLVMRESLSFALRYQGGLVAQLVTYRMDQWVLGLSQPVSSLGVYSVAASVSEVATYPSSAKGMTRFRDAAASVDASARSVIVWTALTTAGAALLVAAAAVLAIPPVFGEDFDDAVRLTLLLLPGALGVGVMRVCANDLSGRGRPGVVSLVALIQAALMVAAFIVLIPEHGADAAAIISSVGYLLGGAATAALLVRERRSGRRPPVGDVLDA